MYSLNYNPSGYITVRDLLTLLNAYKCRTANLNNLRAQIPISAIPTIGTIKTKLYKFYPNPKKTLEIRCCRLEIRLKAQP